MIRCCGIIRCTIGHTDSTIRFTRPTALRRPPESCHNQNGHRHWHRHQTHRQIHQHHQIHRMHRAAPPTCELVGAEVDRVEAQVADKARHAAPHAVVADAELLQLEACGRTYRVRARGSGLGGLGSGVRGLSTLLQPRFPWAPVPRPHLLLPEAVARPPVPRPFDPEPLNPQGSRASGCSSWARATARTGLGFWAQGPLGSVAGPNAWVEGVSNMYEIRREEGRCSHATAGNAWVEGLVHRARESSPGGSPRLGMPGEQQDGVVEGACASPWAPVPHR